MRDWRLPVLGATRDARASPTSAARWSCSTCSPRGATRARPRRRSSSTPSASSPATTAPCSASPTWTTRRDSEQFVRQEHITYPVLRDINGNLPRSFGTDRRPGDVRDRPPGPDRRRPALPARRQLAPADLAAGSWLSACMRRAAVTRHALLLTLSLALAPAAGAAVAPRASLTDIENDVMCVACHEPLAVAQSPQADAERSYIRTLIAQGQTKPQIETRARRPVRARGARPPARARLQPDRLHPAAGARADRGRGPRVHAAEVAPASRARAEAAAHARAAPPLTRRRRAPPRRGPRPPRLSGGGRYIESGALTPSSPSASAIVRCARERQRDPERLGRLGRGARPPGSPGRTR